jgi:transglutaminase-like putative cysteine protease
MCQETLHMVQSELARFWPLNPYGRCRTLPAMYNTRPPLVLRAPLAPGAAGVRQTLCAMRRLAINGASNPLVRSCALGLIRDARVPAADYQGEARALFRWVCDRIRYTRDTTDVELLQAPWITLAEASGDCDDKATLLAALLRSVGTPARLAFRAIGTNPQNPGQFGHVYLVARWGAQRVPLDATREGTMAGWEFPRPTVAMEVPL